MDIEQIEVFLTRTLATLSENEAVPTDTILLAVQVQLLLHVYRKLEAIEEHLTPRHLGEIRYSPRVY